MVSSWKNLEQFRELSIFVEAHTLSADWSEFANFRENTLVNCELCYLFASLRDKSAIGLKDSYALLDS